MNLRRGFTFIELLVVLAIVAILAIILFPVFASAKPAQIATDRRTAASLDNVKQIGQAAFMYAADNDYRSVMHQYWQTDAPVMVGGCGVVTWAWACMPYIANAEILNDPLTTPETPPNGYVPAVWFALFPQYGMNYTVWSSMSTQAGNGAGQCADPWRASPIPLASVARPAEVPLFVSKSTNLEQGGTMWWYGAGTLISSVIVDPPDCIHIAAWCFGSWGSGGNWSNILNMAGTVAGKQTGGNSRRRNGNHVALFGDGHAQLVPAEKMAVGTNWQDNDTWNSGSTVVTDPNVYRWTSQ